MANKTTKQRRVGTTRLIGALGAGLLGFRLLARLRQADLSGDVALVTGGSRGLGFLIARELGRQGCRVVICARDEAELNRARKDLERDGIEVLALTCDVANRFQVDEMIAAAMERFGRIDILVNNAGVIQVGPLNAMRLADFEAAMEIMYWGIVYPTLAVLPQMRARRAGRIVNITSIGGRISVPHLLPYSSAKFAAVGFSEGLRAELSGSGVRVTTIAPGLLRTGSYLNALFKGREEREFLWFGLGASLPLVSMDAERAARQIVQATRSGVAERTLSLPAAVATRVHGLAPGPMADLLGLAGRLTMPQATSPDDTASVRGMEAAEELDSALVQRLTILGRKAASRFHQFPGPSKAIEP